MSDYLEQVERLVTRADFDHANNGDAHGAGTLNSTAEFWHDVAIGLSQEIGVLKREIENRDYVAEIYQEQIAMLKSSEQHWHANAVQMMDERDHWKMESEKARIR